MASLPAVIFQFALSPYKEWQALAGGGGADHHLCGARAQRDSARTRVQGAATTMAESTATNFTTPTVANRPLQPGRQFDEKVSVRQLNFYYGDNRALKNVNCAALCRLGDRLHRPVRLWKSTLLRVLNRIYDLYPNQRADGEVCFTTKTC